MIAANIVRCCLYATLLLGCTVPTGCSQYIDPNVPEPIRPFIEPEFSRQYLLYRPSSYSKHYAWPLVIVCHSAFPDSPNRRIRAWTGLAEDHGFVVVAPKLDGNKRSWLSKADTQIVLQRTDEGHILATIRHVRGAHNISGDRIFIHGHSGGAHAALHTGLRHSDVFRAIALSQPGFDESCMSDAAAATDPHQPVFVEYNVADAIWGKQGRRCADWLRPRCADLTESPHGAVRADDTERSVEFFEEVLRTRPWLSIRALPAPGSDPLEVQFKLRSSYRPARYRWEFGDGHDSSLAEPVHPYSALGTYLVTVTVDAPAGGQQQRSIRLTLPAGTVETVDSAAKTAAGH